MRRLAYEMREKSGIDEVLRTEGLAGDIAELRKLARGEIAGVVSAVRADGRPRPTLRVYPRTQAPRARWRPPLRPHPPRPTPRRSSPTPPRSSSTASASTRARAPTRTAPCPTRPSSTTARSRVPPRERRPLHARRGRMTAASAPTPAPATPETEPDAPAPERDVRMTIWEHLDELRRRIIRAAIGVVVMTVVAWCFRVELLAWLVLPYQHAWMQHFNKPLRASDPRARRRLPRLPRAVAHRGRRRGGARHLLPALVVHLAGPLPQGEAAHRPVRPLLDDALPQRRRLRVLRRVPVHVQLLPVAARPGAPGRRAHADRHARVLPRLHDAVPPRRSAPSSSCRSSSRSWCSRTS